LDGVCFGVSSILYHGAEEKSTGVRLRVGKDRAGKKSAGCRGMFFYVFFNGFYVLFMRFLMFNREKSLKKVRNAFVFALKKRNGHSIVSVK
jgi:hypothetical protein